VSVINAARQVRGTFARAYTKGWTTMGIRECIIAILVNNKPGVLSRVAGVFGRLGYNIESLCVAETISPEISRITSITNADSDFIEKVKKEQTGGCHRGDGTGSWTVRPAGDDTDRDQPGSEQQTGGAADRRHV